MRTGLRRGGLALGGLLVALVAVVAGPGSDVAEAVPAAVGEAPHAGACRQPDGVTVVVNFTAFDGGIEVRCAGWPVSSGYDALRRAGFTVTDTQQFPGLLCRIDGVPADQACVRPPPASAYWGYWHAERGGSWTYSSQGALTRTPPKGSVEGWAFGPKAQPGVAPPAPLPPTTTTTAAPVPTTVARPPASSAPSSPAAPPAPTAAPEPTSTVAPPDAAADELDADELAPGGPPDSNAASPTGGGAFGASSSDEAASLDGFTPSSRRGDADAGSPVAAMATAGAVALLGGGAAVQARRRRQETVH